MDKVQLTTPFSYFFAYMLQIIIGFHAYKTPEMPYNFSWYYF